MRVLMTTTLAGYRDNGELYTYEANEEYDLPSKEAKRVLEQGIAEPVAEKRVQKAEQRAETR